MNAHRSKRICTLLLGLTLAAACRSAGEATGPTPSASPADGLSTAHSYRYDVRMQSTSNVGSSADSVGFAFDLAGSLRVTPLEVTPDGHELALVFEKVSLSGSDEPEARQRFERVALELRQPWLIHYAAGAMDHAELGGDLEALTVGIARNLGAAFQLPDRLATTERELEAREYDATGRYRAAYTRAGEAHRYRKRKVAYEALISDAVLRASLPGREVPPPKIAQADGELELGAGRIVKFEAHEKLELPLVAGSTLASATTITVAQTATVAAQAPPASALSSLRRLAAADAYQTASSQFDFTAIKTGGRSFEELLSMLEALAARRAALDPADRGNADELEPERKQELTRWTGEQNRTLTAMAALLRQQPALASRVLTAVRKGSPAHHVLIAALGTAGVDAAQRALLEVMSDGDLSDEDRNAAGLALIRTKTPTDDSVRALEALLDDRHWHQYAILGLGTYCRLFGEAGRTDEHERLGKLLVARLRQSATADARRDAFSALTNSGYSGMLAAVRPYLDDDEAVTRENAMRALRLVQDADVTAIAIDKLDDAAPGVRLSALDAAARLTPTEQLVQAVERKALGDDSANVRMQALRLLIDWKDSRPRLRATIARVASADPSQSIRQAAERAVASQG